MYAYHYCVSHQLQIGSVAYNSGLVTSTLPIINQERHDALCQTLADKIGWPRETMVVLCLSLLGECPDNG